MLTKIKTGLIAALLSTTVGCSGIESKAIDSKPIQNTYKQSEYQEVIIGPEEMKELESKYPAVRAYNQLKKGTSHEGEIDGWIKGYALLERAYKLSEKNMEKSFNKIEEKK